MTEQRHAALGIHPIDPAATDGSAEGDHAELLKRRQIVKRTQWLTVIVLVLLALGAGRTIFSRIANARELEAGTAERAKQYVKTTLPKTGGAGQTLALPGTLQGFVQAPVAARAAGYVRRWNKDIGARVEKGEVLAEIESPEIDQQLSQAIAARDQTAASLGLATSTVERWEGLRKKDVVSQQDLDEKRSSAAQAKANLAAADANVQRLRQLQGFKSVVAPFAGVITKRNIDVGDLIDLSGKPLFTLSQTDPLRVYVNVPQSYAQLVKTGQAVVVTQGELRGQSFKGTVARTSASIDTATRTMQIEVALPNKEGVLLPGAYVQVSLPLQAGKTMLVPNNALLFRGEGTRVAVVDTSGRVNLRTVALGRNYGENVELLDGIAETDRLVLNPSDSLADGDQVAMAPPTQEKPKDGAKDAAKDAAKEKDKDAQPAKGAL
jgi:RND family efflux transporter MFP subunit